MAEEHDHIKTQKVRDWPIEPTFLSIREGVKDRYSASPNKDGLFDANELRGILADASAALWEGEGIDENIIGTTGRIFALFQVVPEKHSFPTKEDIRGAWFVEFSNAENETIRKILKGQKIIRIHPGNLYPNLKCCELFRESEYNGEKCKHKCYEMDSRIALLYHDKLQTILKDKNDKDNSGKFYDELEKVIEDYNKKKKERYKDDVDDIKSYLLKSDTHTYTHMGKTENRPYVGYRCVYSGFMEYFFPIIHAGKIVAVLMHGQCPPPGLKKAEMFKKYRTITLKQWINKKEKSDKNEVNFNKKIFYLPDDEDYDPIEEQLIEISELIKQLEERIENAVKARSQKYISKKFFDREEIFRKLVIRKTQITSNFGNKLEDLRNEIVDLDKNLQEYK